MPARKCKKKENVYAKFLATEEKVEEASGIQNKEKVLDIEQAEQEDKEPDVAEDTASPRRRKQLISLGPGRVKVVRKEKEKTEITKEVLETEEAAHKEEQGTYNEQTKRKQQNKPKPRKKARKLVTPEQKEKQKLAAQRTKNRHAQREADFVKLIQEMKEFMKEFLRVYPEARKRTEKLMKLLDEAQQVSDHFTARKKRSETRLAKKRMRTGVANSPGTKPAVAVMRHFYDQDMVNEPHVSDKYLDSLLSDGDNAETKTDLPQVFVL